MSDEVTKSLKYLINQTLEIKYIFLDRKYIDGRN